jgi:TetR/AcrR family transcriptional regulator, transcriptional repressor of bet genes
VPKRVDHEQRREEIVQALWQVAMSEGLPATTLRRVAAEAGISMNLVQYYFTTKDQLLHHGMRRVIDRAVARMQSELTTHTGAQAKVRACLLAMLPIDPDSALTSAVYTAYMSYAIHDPEIKAMLQPIAKSLAAQLAPAVPNNLNALAEMESLVAMVGGLTQQILIETYTVDEATALVDHQLNRLFAAQP